MNNKDQHKSPKSSTSEPTTVTGRSKNRRQTYVSGNHLLNFEVTCTPMIGALGSRPPKSTRGTHPLYSKERYIHANFRFVSRHGLVGEATIDSLIKNPDAPLPWEAIELVIVPVIAEQLTCPICLDTPVAPKLTGCGHYFCSSCILRYASSSSSFERSDGGWRKCPVCFENINTRSVKSVHFNLVGDYAARGVAEVSEIGIPMTLLYTITGRTKVVAATASNNSLSPTFHSNPENISQLSPFDKVTFVNREFVLNEIIEKEATELSTRLKCLQEAIKCFMESVEEEEIFYTQMALSMTDDRRNKILNEKEEISIPDLIEEKSCPSLSANMTFFHQSIDGQAYFPCPLTMKILRKHFGDYSMFPTFICAPVLEIEMDVMTEELRKKYRYLHHLPLGCQIGLCEIDLSGIVSVETLLEFSEEIASRALIRKKRAAKENKMALAQEQINNKSMNIFSSSWPESDILSNEYTASTTNASFQVSPPLQIRDDYENFPLPVGSSEADAIDIPNASQNRPKSGQLAGSFASIAASSPPLLPESNTFYFDPHVPIDISGGGDDGKKGASRKGKKILLVSNATQRRS